MSSFIAFRNPILGQDLSLKQELHNWLGWLAHDPWGSCCLCLPSSGIINVCNTNAGGQNSGPYACAASTTDPATVTAPKIRFWCNLK